MTEHEAWLELARIFEPGKPTPIFYHDCDERITGICQGTAYLRGRDQITDSMERRMDNRMDCYFQPSDPGTFYWPQQRNRAARATACGLLAAITGGTP